MSTGISADGGLTTQLGRIWTHESSHRTDACVRIDPPRAADSKISVVAAENFYGDVARQIGGDDVAIASIMSNPDQDPHLFETTPSTCLLYTSPSPRDR